jgi:hypothetical protein
MNVVDIRDAIIKHMSLLEAKWQAEGRPLHVELDNQDDIDLNNLPDNFAVLSIDWGEVTQKNVAFNPDERYHGNIVVFLVGKVGTGTRDRLVIQSEIIEHFKFKAFGGVQTRQPQPGRAPGRSEKQSGWHTMTVMFPFFADSDTTPTI